jgi:hypothetical protein
MLCRLLPVLPVHNRLYVVHPASGW